MNDINLLDLVYTAGVAIHLSLKGRFNFITLDAGTSPKLLQKLKLLCI